MLIKVKLSDKKYFAKWWNDSDLRKLTSGRPGLISDKQVEKYFSALLKTTKDYHFIIILNQKAIGHVNLLKRRDNWYETQIIIGEKKYWGKGYGTEAIKSIIKKTKRMRISKIYLEVRPNNLRAIRAYKKCGFVGIGTKKYPKNKYLPKTLRMELKSINIPKVKFIQIPIETETKVISWFLFRNEWRWGEVILKKFPGLKPIYKLKNEKDKFIFLSKYLYKFKASNKEKLLAKEKNFEKEWRKIERDYSILLTKIINTDWPRAKKEIRAMISVNPICPRFLDDWSFSVSYRYNAKDVMPVIMHEICHFLYFEKWKQLFPKSERRTWDYPYIEWHLSELVAPIILNDQRFKGILKQRATFYREHQRVKIKGVSAPEYFSKLYTDRIKQHENFDYFIKEAYRIIKKHKNKFLSIKK